jgi:hypothetical protein
MLGGMALTGCILYLFTAVTLGRSISDSGELNIVSTLIALAIDQLTVRPTLAMLFIATYGLFQKLALNTAFFVLFCQEEPYYV